MSHETVFIRKLVLADLNIDVIHIRNGIIFLCIAVEPMSLLTVFRAKLHRICTRLSAFLTLLIRVECSVLRKLQLQDYERETFNR